MLTKERNGAGLNVALNARLQLIEEIHERTAGDHGSGLGRMLPAKAGDAGLDGEALDFVVGRMVLDEIDMHAVAVVRVEHRLMRVREA